MTLIVDGTTGVTFNDSSLQGAAASPYVLKNRIINGDMRIDQRNNGSSVTPTTDAFITDRWQAALTSSTTFFSWQQSSTAPTGFTKSLLATSLGANTPSAGQIYTLQYKIEGFNTADFNWGSASAQTVTLSFWVRASVTGTYGVIIANSGITRAYPATYTINVANTGEQKTITIAGDTSGTWATDNTTGMRIEFNLGTGSTYSIASGSGWVTKAGDAWSVSGTTNISATNGATWYLTGVQLEVGSTATPFERRMYGTELALCQRYYFKDMPTNNYSSFCMGMFYSGTTAQMVYPHKVTMRTVSPTVVVSGVNVQSATSQTSNISTVAGSYPGPNSTLIELSVSGFTARDAAWLNTGSNGATAFVSLDAEL